jgi:hypothetical protein
MRNAFFSVLITLLVLPAFAPLLPHGAAHAFHDHQAQHHGVQNHGHAHEEHDHKAQTQEVAHHPINLDVVTYFSDYLHVDLQSPDQVVLKAPTPDSQDTLLILPADIEPQHRYELASAQSRAPPDWRRYRPENTPLYLSTQRLRI